MKVRFFSALTESATVQNGDSPSCGIILENPDASALTAQDFFSGKIDKEVIA